MYHSSALGYQLKIKLQTRLSVVSLRLQNIGGNDFILHWTHQIRDEYDINLSNAFLKSALQSFLIQLFLII